MSAPPARRVLGALAAFGGFVASAGCAEPPAFELSWSVVNASVVRAIELEEAAKVRAELESQGVFDPVVIANTVENTLASEPVQARIDAAAAGLAAVSDCSKLGIATIRVTTSGAVDMVHEFDCVPNMGAYEGPSLEPGLYDISIEGLRRNGEPWTCPDAGLRSRCIARTFLRDVELGAETTVLPAVTLVAPFECDDGIDNDRDGLVDRSDAACIADIHSAEDTDFRFTLIQPAVSFLDDNEIARPANLAISSLRMFVDGELLASVGNDELDYETSPFRLPLKAESFEPGQHLFTLSAFGPVSVGDTIEIHELVTPFEHSFNVLEGEVSFITEHFSFTSDRFLAPIILPLELGFELGFAGSGNGCRLGGFLDLDDNGTNETPQRLDTVRVRVTDTQANVTLDAASLGLTGTAVSGPIVGVDDPNDPGWVSFACPASAVSSAPLTWGRYTIEVEAMRAGDTCFTHTEPSLLRPGLPDAQSFTLTRTEGTPSPGCVECTADGTLKCSSQICVDGLCVDP